MRISDWSSDVCSSDLRCADADARPRLGLAAPGQPDAPAARGRRTRGVPARQSRARRHLYGYVAKLGNRGLARSVREARTGLAARARSEERRGGKEWVSTCISLWSPYN